MLHGLLCGRQGLLSGCGVQASHGFCSCRAQALRLSNCGTWAKLLCSVWDLLGPGIEPVSPASGGGFSTTEPPGKPQLLS